MKTRGTVVSVFGNEMKRVILILHAINVDERRYGVDSCHIRGQVG